MGSFSVSSHPTLLCKISKLRQGGLSSKKVKELVEEISTILAVESIAEEFKSIQGPIANTILGKEFTTSQINPNNYVIIPILRSGVSMIDPFLKILPNDSIPIHYLGLFREESTLSPIEYYNKLPPNKGQNVDIAFVLDPVIATGGTACAVITTLKEWGVKKIVFISLIASEAGLHKITKNYDDTVQIYIGQVDSGLSESGMIIPGLGDIGDRLNSSS